MRHPSISGLKYVGRMLSGLGIYQSSLFLRKISLAMIIHASPANFGKHRASDANVCPIQEIGLIQVLSRAVIGYLVI